MMYVKRANAPVIAKFPVILTPSGVNPKTFENQIKKKIVNKKLMYFL